MAKVLEHKIEKGNAEEFDMIMPILNAVFIEMKELSKKKQDGVLNTMKVNMINRLLSKLKIILKDDPTSEFLDLLDTEALPSNSDAVLVIAHFIGAMNQYKEKRFGWNGTAHTWNFSNLDEDPF